jgi:hypothetical protein
MPQKRFLAIAVVIAAALLAGSAMAQQIPPGTAVPVRIGSTISSGTAHSGQTFDGTVARDVVVNGATIVKAGAPVQGRVSYVKSSGRLHNPGVLSLRLTSIGGQAVTTNAVSRKGKSHTKSNAVKIGGGTAAGALIGGLAGGGRGAAIGAGAGAGAGTGVAAYTGKKEAVISAESTLTFTVSGGSTAGSNKGRR